MWSQLGQVRQALVTVVQLPTADLAQLLWRPSKAAKVEVWASCCEPFQQMKLNVVWPALMWCGLGM
jgi:hypothetical protein